MISGSRSEDMADELKTWRRYEELRPDELADIKP